MNMEVELESFLQLLSTEIELKGFFTFFLLLNSYLYH